MFKKYFAGKLNITNNGFEHCETVLFCAPSELSACAALEAIAMNHYEDATESASHGVKRWEIEGEGLFVETGRVREISEQAYNELIDFI